MDLTLLSSIAGAQGATGGFFQNYHNCATKPERLTASARRTLPPALLVLAVRVRNRSLPNQAARSPWRVRPGLPCARASSPRPTAVALPLRRPVRFARRLSRSIGPTHLRRHRAGPAAGPGAEATLAEKSGGGAGAAAMAGTRPGAAAVTAPPLRTRPWLGPPAAASRAPIGWA